MTGHHSRQSGVGGEVEKFEDQVLQKEATAEIEREIREDVLGDDFDLEKLQERPIVLNQHCYGCTAGAGSSCGGAIE